MKMGDVKGCCVVLTLAVVKISSLKGMILNLVMLNKLKMPHQFLIVSQSVRLIKAFVSLTLCCFVVYSTRRFVVCLTMCHFVLVFFSPFSIAITSLGEERANLGAFCAFVRFVLVWNCRFPLPLGVWEGLRFVIVALPGLFSYLFFDTNSQTK